MFNKKENRAFIPYGRAYVKKEERDAIDNVLERNWWGLDSEGAAFQKELAEAIGVKHAIFVTSGSAALHLGILAAKLPYGSEVIVPACTFPTPIASLIQAGLKPVVVDVDPRTNFINPELLEEAITPNTKAILIVYVAGNIGNIEQVMSIANSNNLVVFEDNCDGFGGTWNNKYIGTYGLFSAISMHAAHIITTGQGGVIFTDEDSLAETALCMRDWGRIPQSTKNISFGDMPHDHFRFMYTELGGNYQPLELQAAMGRVQLRRLHDFKTTRKRNAQILLDLLKPLSHLIELPTPPEEADPCWMAFPIVLHERIDRSSFTELITKNGIDWRPILASNIARQPAYKEHVRVSGPLNRAEQLLHSGLWLPLGHTLTVDDMEYIAKTIHTIIEELGIEHDSKKPSTVLQHS